MQMTTQSLTVVVLSTDLDNFNEFRNALSADGRAKLLSGGNDVEQVFEQVSRFKPSAAIISLGADAIQAIKLIQRLNSECPDTAVISAAHETSADLILQSLRAGAREFLRLPIDAGEFSTVIDQVAEFCAGKVEAEKKTGRMTVVFSSKGGCGTSFIATNLAASATVRTVLVDLNLEVGDLPLFLGLKPKHSIADMVARHGRLDDHLISAFVTPYSANLDLVAAPKELDPIDKIEQAHVLEVLQKLREYYDYVVLDPRHTFDPITLTALDQSDEIVLVLTLDIPAIRSAQRALQIFDRVGCPRRKVRVVVNRWSKQTDVDLREVEKLFGESVYGSLPSDYQTVVNSINLGTPLVLSNSRAKVAREIRRLAHDLSSGTSHKPEVKPKRSWNFFLRHRPAEKQ
jgi:pilus assembly protein CpaE